MGRATVGVPTRDPAGRSGRVGTYAPERDRETMADPPGAERPFRERVCEIVKRIPDGRVLSYGDVAALAGSPRAARGVGSVLNALPEDHDVPWWRVIGASGRLTIPAHLGLRALQRTLLEREGVEFGPNDAVDLVRFRWDGS